MERSVVVEEARRSRSASPAQAAAAAAPTMQRGFAAANGSTCRVELCRKVRERLQLQRSGRDSGRDLEQLWITRKLWEAIKSDLGKVRSALSYLVTGKSIANHSQERVPNCELVPI